jgi:hypothetical protein
MNGVTGQSIGKAPDFSDFSDGELHNMLQDTTCRDQHDDIEIELENRDRRSRGLEPL